MEGWGLSPSPYGKPFDLVDLLVLVHLVNARIGTPIFVLTFERQFKRNSIIYTPYGDLNSWIFVFKLMSTSGSV